MLLGADAWTGLSRPDGTATEGWFRMVASRASRLKWRPSALGTHGVLVSFSCVLVAVAGSLSWRDPTLTRWEGRHRQGIVLGLGRGGLVDSPNSVPWRPSERTPVLTSNLFPLVAMGRPFRWATLYRAGQERAGTLRSRCSC